MTYRENESLLFSAAACNYTKFAVCVFFLMQNCYVWSHYKCFITVRINFMEVSLLEWKIIIEKVYGWGGVKNVAEI